MKHDSFKRMILAAAIAAASGVAFAQSPANPPTDRGAAGADKSSGGIVDRQTQPPREAGSSTESAAERKGGQGAGAAEKSSGEIIDRQTKPAQGTSSSGTAGSGAPTPRTTDTTSGRIIDEQTKPGAGKMDPAQRGGTTR